VLYKGDFLLSDKLHLGCGDTYLPGWVNVDIGECKADVIHNLDQIPYPFEENQFSVIIANHVIEHLDRARWPEIIAELYRISAPNAIWDFRCPYAFSDNYATDPTHKNPLSARSFNYFDSTLLPHGRLGEIYGFRAKLRVLIGRKIDIGEYGPDLHFRLLVVKEELAPIRIPENFVNPLYGEFNPVKDKLRVMFYRIPGMRKLRGK
jgi:hypothetical protein